MAFLQSLGLKSLNKTKVAPLSFIELEVFYFLMKKIKLGILKMAFFKNWNLPYAKLGWGWWGHRVRPQAELVGGTGGDEVQ